MVFTSNLLREVQFEILTLFWTVFGLCARPQKILPDLKTNCTFWKMTANTNFALLPPLIKTVKKFFSSKEGENNAKGRGGVKLAFFTLDTKKGSIAWFNLLVSFVYLFPFFIAGFLGQRRAKTNHRFSGFRFLVEPSDLTVGKNSPALFNCEATVNEGYPRPIIRWKRNGQFLQFPDFNDRRYVIFVSTLFNWTFPTLFDRLSNISRSLS